MAMTLKTSTTQPAQPPEPFNPSSDLTRLEARLVDNRKPQLKGGGGGDLEWLPPVG
jgi:hypothetical protein